MFDRIFLMGVSPVTLDDLSSGYNIDWNISRLIPRFNAMIGFERNGCTGDARLLPDKNGMLVGDVDAMIT